MNRGSLVWRALVWVGAICPHSWRPAKHMGGPARYCGICGETEPLSAAEFFADFGGAAFNRLMKAPATAGLPWVAPALLLALLVPGTAHAQDASPAPAEPPVRVSVAAGVALTMGDAGAKPTPSARISVEGPIAGTPLGASITADVLGLPGATQALALDALDTWTAIRAQGALTYTVGSLDRAGQRVRTRLTVFGGFASRFGSDPAPADRSPRFYGAGVELVEETQGAHLRIAVGHDDATGLELGRGHILLSASVPVSATHGLVNVVGEASLVLGHPGTPTHDRISVGIMVHPPSAAPSPPTPAAASPAVAPPAPISESDPAHASDERARSGVSSQADERARVRTAASVSTLTTTQTSETCAMGAPTTASNSAGRPL